MSEPLSSDDRALIAATCAALARWLVEWTLPELEERYLDPAERWQALKANLRKYVEKDGA